MTIDTNIRYNDNLTAQQIFDLTVYHLGTMEARSVGDTGGCRYHNEDGNSCAVGYFISDSEYSLEMEGAPIYNTRMDELLPPRLKPHLRLLSDLQQVHDDSCLWTDGRRDMAECLSGIAEHLNLDPAILNHPELIWNK